MRRLLAMGTALVVHFLAIAVAFANSPLQFRNSVRTLESLQDATAFGDPQAADLQAKLTTQIEADLKYAQKADIRNIKNLRAIAIYLFSGGNPDAAERRLASITMDADTKNLLDGALAYTRGDKPNALKFLEPINPAELPSNLGGRVALVKAIVTAAQDLKASLKLLNTARALMPGTLVEEAALRRCVTFAGKASDVTHLENCASVYIRRFSKSIYWKEFEDNFITALMEVDYMNGVGSAANLDVVLGDLSGVEHRRMLLLIARTATNRGRFKLAEASAGRAMELARACSLDMARARLYLAAAGVADGSAEGSKVILEAINPKSLEGADVALRDKAINLAAQILQPPLISKDEALQTLAPDERSIGQSDDYIKLLARAQNALSDAPATTLQE